MVGLGRYFKKGFLSTLCFILPSQPCSLKASTDPVFGVAPYTLLSYSEVSPWGGHGSRELEHFCNPQESPRGEFAASWGRDAATGEHPWGLAGSIFQPCLHPPPHCGQDPIVSGILAVAPSSWKNMLPFKSRWEFSSGGNNKSFSVVAIVCFCFDFCLSYL